MQFSEFISDLQFISLYRNKKAFQSNGGPKLNKFEQVRVWSHGDTLPRMTDRHD